MSNNGYEYITIGVLTTAKKAPKFQLRYLTDRLEAFGEFKARILVSEDMDKIPVEEWPLFDILIPYHLDSPFFLKAMRYVELRKVFVFNDLRLQEKILNRKFVYDTMKKNGIPTLPYLTINHLDTEDTKTFVETDDYIEFKGMKLAKPFVEKPVSARRHDVYIYYNKEMGGGTRKLFRKRGNQSSKFYPDQSNVRKDGIYIYEKFVNSLNDIKIYTVLPEYAYAEKRKSPNVDGVVERNVEGFEVRKICPLTLKENSIAKKIIATFKQNMCGFDILRKDEKNSFVIDVNGMSFVKYNVKFYDDATHIIRNFFLKKMRERRHPFYVMRNLSRKNLKADGKLDKFKGDLLLGVITIFRHGDRTPKQKEKIKTSCKTALDLFKDTGAQKTLLFKTPEEFSLVSNIFNEIQNDNVEMESRKIEMVQKALKKGMPGTKVQIKASFGSDGSVEAVRIACKWGGLLTDDGKNQCMRYAKNFKNLYKGLDDFEPFTKKSRVYASNEKRVQDSARIFTDTLIGEKNRLKIRSDEEIEIFLNHASGADKMREEVKTHLSRIFNIGEEDLVYNKEDIKPILSSNNPWLVRSFKRLGNTKARMVELLSSVRRLVNHLEYFCESNKHYLKNKESIFEIYCRWNEILAGLHNDKKFHLSKAIQIYDYLKYDLKHNFSIFKNFRSMYKNLKTINDFLSPAEYGITNDEKFKISRIIIKNLLKVFIKKLRSIREKKSTDKTFIFFASKSLLYGLRGFFLHCKLAANVSVFENFDKAEFDYLSHVIIRLYEDTSRELEDPMRFYVNIMFSPGVQGDPFVRVDTKKYKKNVFEILNPLLDKMAFEDFCQVLVEKLED